MFRLTIFWEWKMISVISQNNMKSNFQTRLKELREEKDLLQKDLAKILNVSKSAVSGWEVGRNQPSYDILMQIAAFFNVTVDYLIGYTE